MKAEKFEQDFDAGVDLTASLDLSKAKRVLQEQKRVNVPLVNQNEDFPAQNGPDSLLKQDYPFDSRSASREC